MEPVAAPSVTSWLDRLQEADPEVAQSCSAALTYLLTDLKHLQQPLAVGEG